MTHLATYEEVIKNNNKKPDKIGDEINALKEAIDKAIEQEDSLLDESITQED